jgi:lipoprotein-releasing system permease protein
MKLPFRIALRYLFSVRKFHFITFITVISIIGIVIGVAALIIVMSIFNGFGEFTEQQLIGVDPHIRILPANGAWLENYKSITAGLHSYDEIKAFAPVINGRMIITAKDNMKVVQLFGFDAKNYSTVSGLNKSVINGEFTIDDTETGKSLVLGAGLAYALKVNVESQVRIMSFKDVEKSILTMSRRPGTGMQVTGIFSTNNPEYDDTYGITSIENAARLLKVPVNAVSAIDIRLFNIETAEKLKEKLLEKYPGSTVLTWFDLHRELYTILKLERLAVFVVLSLIIIIAVFNILASLSMTVVEKRSDIGVLKALGASDKFIRKTYLYLGSLIGLISTGIGTAIGLGFCYGQIHYHWIKLNSAQYLIKSLPLTVVWTDVLLVICVALGFSFLATVYPAKRAASVHVIEAIREE